MDRLEGKIALVTGGGSGIGRATALACAREGAEVVVADIDPGSASGTVDLIREAGGRAWAVPVDVSRGEEVRALLEAIRERYGRLDCAHNNAGITGGAFLTGLYPEEEWDRVLGINLKGVWLCMKYELALMAPRSHGVIVNTSSGAGLAGLPYQCAYAASKHAVIGLSKTAASEYARHGIRVNVVCPGFIDTGLTRQVLAKKPALEEKYKARVPLGRFGTDEEVAEAVVWLFSEASSFVIGHTLVVDGGASI